MLSIAGVGRHSSFSKVLSTGDCSRRSTRELRKVLGMTVGYLPPWTTMPLQDHVIDSSATSRYSGLDIMTRTNHLFASHCELGNPEGLHQTSRRSCREFLKLLKRLFELICEQVIIKDLQRRPITLRNHLVLASCFHLVNNFSMDEL